MAEATQTKGSIVWQYFDKLESGKAKCKECRSELACSSDQTSSLAWHLEA